VLRVEDITVAISAVTILRGLSLTVETGAIVGLVGRNGAGKTTAIRSVMGLTHLSSGRIDLDGNKLDGMNSYMRAGSASATCLKIAAWWARCRFATTC
jgi:branched-chain amino acid transport system ATP-binding protein